MDKEKLREALVAFLLTATEIVEGENMYAIKTNRGEIKRTLKDYRVDSFENGAMVHGTLCPKDMDDVLSSDEFISACENNEHLDVSDFILENEWQSYFDLEDFLTESWDLFINYLKNEGIEGVEKDNFNMTYCSISIR